MEYEVVIGLEVHVQVKTASKLFSPSGYAYGANPNSLTDPVVLSLPGALPVFNGETIRQAIRAGLIFGEVGSKKLFLPR
jgi:aspartyl-tRNA(Asn)/glutamyl-tRNA(Gln) amidotransferase subunit B